MPYDSFTVCAVTTELNKLLNEAKINKIYQPEKDEIVLSLYAGKNYRLLLSCGALYPRLHISERIKENPETPYSFCMLLRKYLTGGTVLSFEQLPYDRVITVTIQNSSEMFDTVKYKLIIEIMGRQSNIILCNEENKILALQKTVSLDSKRAMLTGLKYTYPQSEKTRIDDIAAVKKISDTLLGGITTDYILSVFKGFSLQTADHIVSMTKNGKTLAQALFDFDKTVKSGNYNPCIEMLGNNPFEHYIIPYNNITGKLTFYDTVNACIDAFYSGKDKGKRITDKKREIKTALNNFLKKTQKKVALLLEKTEQCKQAETYKKYGELITANIYKIKGKQKSITLQDYYNDYEEITVELDENLSPAANSQKYFKKYTKLKKAKEQTDIMLVSAYEQLAYIKSVEEYSEKADSLEELDEIREELALSGIIKTKNIPAAGKKVSALKVIKKEIDDCIIYCGKNNIQNEYITFKLAKPNDIWLHIKNAHGPHVIIKSESGKISDKILLEAAKMAAALGNKNDKADIDYTQKKYVKKPSGRTIGYVTYSNHKTITVKI